MSYSSRFTSNRFAALSEDYNGSAPAPSATPALATRTWAPDADTGAAAAARSALSTSSEYKSPSNIFRRGNSGGAPSHMPGAFQGMRSGAGTASGGWQTTGYRGLHNSSAAAVAAAAAPPPPKTYEEEFPSLGGKPKAATPQPKKAHAQNFANLAKSWATTTAEEEAVAAARRAEAEKEARRQAYNDGIYHSLMVRRAAAAAASASAYEEPDYNEEFYPTQEPLSNDDFDRPPSPHSPPYDPYEDDSWKSDPANHRWVEEE